MRLWFSIFSFERLGRKPLEHVLGSFDQVGRVAGDSEGLAHGEYHIARAEHEANAFAAGEGFERVLPPAGEHSVFPLGRRLSKVFRLRMRFRSPAGSDAMGRGQSATGCEGIIDASS